MTTRTPVSKRRQRMTKHKDTTPDTLDQQKVQAVTKLAAALFNGAGLSHSELFSVTTTLLLNAILFTIKDAAKDDGCVAQDVAKECRMVASVLERLAQCVDNPVKAEQVLVTTAAETHAQHVAPAPVATVPPAKGVH